MQAMPALVDTHCHLNHRDFTPDLPAVLARAKAVGVRHIVCAGYDLESSESAVEIASQVSCVSAAVGVHPHDAEDFTPEQEARIRALASQPCVVAIGETGLDYYRDLSPRDVQQDAFRRHIALAHELDLPLIIHSRDAQQDVLAILHECGLPKRGVVMHCLPSDEEFALQAVGMGCYLGIAGPVTFGNAEGLRRIVAELPLNRLLVETDAPYLTPHPFRGKRNEPAHVRLTAEKVAEVQGLEYHQVAEITTANAVLLFGLNENAFH